MRLPFPFYRLNLNLETSTFSPLCKDGVGWEGEMGGQICTEGLGLTHLLSFLLRGVGKEKKERRKA